MTHHIRQLYLHAETNSTDSDGLALQRRLAELCQHTLLPALEQVLNQFNPPEGTLCIDHLAIAATDRLTLENLEAELPKLVAQALTAALREHTTTGRLPAGRATRQQTRQEVVAEALTHFLETGRLPWFFQLPAGRTLEQTVLGSWQQSADYSTSDAPGSQVLRRVLTSASARKRLVWQFSAAFLATLLARLSPASPTLVEQVLTRLHQAGLPSQDTRQFTRQIWESAFLYGAAGNTPTAQQLVGEAWRSGPVTPPLTSVVERHWPAATVPHPPAAPSVASPRPSSFDAAEGIYINNAGLVLLHPFLPQFFQALGVGSEGALQQPNRALGLLHYLATGQLGAPEYELPLPKLLCNLDLEAPVERAEELTPTEAEEATALLEAVIGHWQSLRSTAPDGLRGTFLVRPGKLSRRNTGDWLLQVEPQAYDILLADLPWGISMIQLPWMEHLLWVEWG